MRYGAQAPRLRNVPPYVKTYGREVCDLMREIGKPVLPWQRSIVHDVFGVRADGKWAAYETAVLIARQNGKGVITEAQELGGLYLLREKKVIHSAHLFDTALEAFNRIVELIDNSDWLRRRTAKINRSHGSEGIQLTSAAGGGVLKFKARTVHGARGFSGNRVVLDEAYGLTVAQMQAVSSVLATWPNAQITYTSSPPDRKTGPLPENAMLPSIRKRGIAGDPRMAYYEWSPPKGTHPQEAVGVDLWYDTNPSLGYLIDEEYLSDEYRLFSGAPDGLNAFLTEHCGHWPPEASEQFLVIPETDWTDAADATSQPIDPVAFAIVMSADRQWCSILAAGARDDGLLHVELIDRRRGTGWVTSRVATLNERWRPLTTAIDPGGPAASLIPELDDAKVPLYKLTTRDVASAAGAFFDAVCGRPAIDPDTGELGRDPRVLRHRDQAEVNTAVAGALKRPLGMAWAWDQKRARSDISPLIGASNALWAYILHARPTEPPEPMVAWR